MVASIGKVSSLVPTISGSGRACDGHGGLAARRIITRRNLGPPAHPRRRVRTARPFAGGLGFDSESVLDALRSAAARAPSRLSESPARTHSPVSRPGLQHRRRRAHAHPSRIGSSRMSESDWAFKFPDLRVAQWSRVALAPGPARLGSPNRPGPSSSRWRVPDSEVRRIFPHVRVAPGPPGLGSAV